MFYITISNGLLRDGHRKRMGSSVWEFMWMLDKVTRIDDDGMGWVLGGKVIKLQEIAADLETHPDTISENIIKLENEGYIEKQVASHGMILRVKKAKKRFGKNTEPRRTTFGGNAEPRSVETPNHHRKNAEPHIRCKTIAVDNTQGGHARAREERPALKVAKEKAGAAWEQFKAEIDKYLSNGRRLTITDNISREIFHALGGHAALKEGKSSPVDKSVFVVMYTNRELNNYLKRDRTK